MDHKTLHTHPYWMHWCIDYTQSRLVPHISHTMVYTGCTVWCQQLSLLVVPPIASHSSHQDRYLPVFCTQSTQKNVDQETQYNIINTCSPWRLTMMVLHDIQPALLFTYGNGPAQPCEPHPSKHDPHSPVHNGLLTL